MEKETSTGNASEKTGRVLNFNVMKPPEHSTDREIAEAVAWWKDRLHALQEMKITKAPITDGKNWKETRSGDQLNEVSSSFFSAEGAEVQKGDHSWRQMMIRQRSEKVPTQEGTSEEVSGVVILLKDPQGRTFVIVDQEPGAKRIDVDGEEKHPTLKGIQTSIEKLNKLTDPSIPASEREKFDKTLFPIAEVFSQGLVLKEASTDGNRMYSNVLYGELNLTEEQAAKIQASVPDGKFLTEKQLAVLPLNGLLQTARTVVRDIKTQRELASAA